MLSCTTNLMKNSLSGFCFEYYRCYTVYTQNSRRMTLLTVNSETCFNFYYNLYTSQEFNIRLTNHDVHIRIRSLNTNSQQLNERESIIDWKLINKTTYFYCTETNRMTMMRSMYRQVLSLFSGLPMGGRGLIRTKSVAPVHIRSLSIIQAE